MLSRTFQEVSRDLQGLQKWLRKSQEVYGLFKEMLKALEVFNGA